MSNIPSTQELGRRLKAERERLGMSQEIFGEIGGVSRVSQYLYERGERGPAFEYLGRVVAAGADIGFLLLGVRGKDAKGRVCLDDEVIDSIYRLVDDFARDSDGRLLDIQYRLALFRSFRQAVAGKNAEDIDWPALRAGQHQAG